MKLFSINFKILLDNSKNLNKYKLIFYLNKLKSKNVKNKYLSKNI